MAPKADSMIRNCNENDNDNKNRNSNGDSRNLNNNGSTSINNDNIACANNDSMNTLHCDYLVVGAGTAGMSFIDTLLTENSTATIILVDRNIKPGGHWVHAYPFVKLHQASCNYGVNSVQLGKSRTSTNPWNPWNNGSYELYDMDDRATGTEVVEYYQKVREMFEQTGRVQCYFHVEYNFNEKTGLHTLHSIITSSSTSGKDDKLSPRFIAATVKCTKVVTVSNNVTVPSNRTPLIPVNKCVHFVPVNDLSSSVQSGKYKKYIVFGNGKTGTDALVHLIEHHKIDPSQITWIISRDVWYWLRDVMKNFYGMISIFKCGLFESNSVKECFRIFENVGLFCKLDPKRQTEDPKVFKGPAIDRKELHMMRSVTNVVRLGRATSIEKNKILLVEGHLDFSTEDTLLIDCMNDHWVGGIYHEDFTIFESGKINLGPQIIHFNSSATSAVLAFLECALNDDDASKNKYCYFLRGKQYSEPRPENSFLGAIYLQDKTLSVLMKKIPKFSIFFMNSRTNVISPQHHKGGLIRFLWFLYGPEQFAKFGKNLTTKIDSNGFNDLNHCFGIESFNEDQDATSLPVGMITIAVVAAVAVVTAKYLSSSSP